MADSEYYRMLRENPPAKRKKESHKGNWSLIWEYLGQSQVVMADKPYAVLQSVRKRMQASVNKGKLTIVPYK